MTQPYTRTQAAPVSWFEFATRHRASIASLVVLIFPLVMPFTALAANILIYGLYALGFNLVYGYLGLLSFGHAALLGTGAYFCGIASRAFWPALVRGDRARHCRRAVDGGADRRARDPDPWHLFRDGDDGAVAMRLLPVL